MIGGQAFIDLRKRFGREKTSKSDEKNQPKMMANNLRVESGKAPITRGDGR
jgi:hypothetical protein